MRVRSRVGGRSRGMLPPFANTAHQAIARAAHASARPCSTGPTTAAGSNSSDQPIVLHGAATLGRVVMTGHGVMLPTLPKLENATVTVNGIKVAITIIKLLR